MAAIRLRAIFCEGARTLRLLTPSGTVAVRPASQRHPVLGAVDEICGGGFEPLTRVGRIDWRDPDRIPPVLEPSRLPASSGTGLLNTIAEAAAAPLRYRGPYPTAALYHSLAASFRASDTVDAFTRGAEEAAILGAEVEPEVWFEPAPFARYRTGRVTAQVRDEVVEAIYIGGARFGRGAAIGRVLESRGSTAVARLVVPGSPPVDLAAVDAAGRLSWDRGDPPPLDGPHLGQPLPAPVSAAIMAAARAAAPALLGAGLDAVSARPIVWGDTGLELARIAGDRIAVHGNLALGDLEPAILLATLVEAAVPALLRLAQRALS